MTPKPVKNGYFDIALMQQLGKLELIARYVVEGFITGLHKSPFHGFSVEFAEHRQYNPGESTRHIDWKLYGRTDKLFVKKYEEETNLRCQIVIDMSSSMFYPAPEYNKFTFSAYAAASLLYMLRNQRDATGLTLYSDKIDEHYPARSSYAHLQLLFNSLQNKVSGFELNRTTSTAEVLHQIAETIHKRSMVIIFSDMFENQTNEKDYFSGLQHLKFKKHEIILFHVTDKRKEIEFDFENRPFRFTDMETDQKVDLFPDEYREIYRKHIQELKNKLAVKCLQYQIDMIEADIHDGYFQVIQNFLIKRQKLY